MVNFSPSQGANSFAIDFYKTVSKEYRRNLFLSPASILSTMAMAFLGSKGETAKQIANLLHLSTSDGGKLSQDFFMFLNDLKTTSLEPGISEGVELFISNSVWGMIDIEFKLEFLESVKEMFATEVNKIDFGESLEAAKKINEWIEGKTRQKIKNFIAPALLNPNTRLILANAIYFYGKWGFPFPEYKTVDELFFLNPRENVQVKMMKQLNRFAYFENDDFQVLRLPYKGNGVSMLIFLPKDKEGLAEFERYLSREKFENWLPSFSMREVNVRFPRFKQESSLGLVSHFNKLGLVAPFDSKIADVSEICSGKEQIYISEVFHKTFVKVDEEGTEAAAATTGLWLRIGESPPPSPKDFFANHPFLFIIFHEKTNSILFIGKVLKPED